MSRDFAIPSLGPVYFVRDNQIIGTGRVGAMMGQIYASVHVTDGQLVEPLIKHPTVITLAKIKSDDEHIHHGLRYALFRFACLDGRFIGGNYENEEGQTDADCESILKNVRVVNKDEFDWGMAPPDFKSVPGYGNKRDQVTE